MKYFTPDLHVRLQGAETGLMDLADEAWERALADYRCRLKTIKPKLPPSARAFLDQTRLHDAEVLWIGRALPFFGVLLRPDSSAATVGVSYLGVRDVRFQRQTIPSEFCGSRMQWMYDEIDLGEGDGSFLHSVLFSDGSQLTLEAREIHMATLDTVYAQFDLAHAAASV